MYKILLVILHRINSLIQTHPLKHTISIQLIKGR